MYKPFRNLVFFMIFIYIYIYVIDILLKNVSKHIIVFMRSFLVLNTVLRGLENELLKPEHIVSLIIRSTLVVTEQHEV